MEGCLGLYLIMIGFVMVMQGNDFWGIALIVFVMFAPKMWEIAIDVLGKEDK